MSDNIIPFRPRAREPGMPQDPAMAALAWALVIVANQPGQAAESSELINMMRSDLSPKIRVRVDEAIEWAKSRIQSAANDMLAADESDE